MTKTTFKRCTVTLDLATIRKSKELASEMGQSVSSVIRYVIGHAYDEAVQAKEHRESIGHG
jgi:hypothetical protein